MPYHPSAEAAILLHHAFGVRILDNEISGNGTRISTGACGVFAQMVGELEIANNHVNNNGASHPKPQPVSVDFFNMQAGKIGDPSTFSGAVFEVGGGKAFLIPTDDGVALDCGILTVVLLPNPVRSVTLWVKNSSVDGAPVTVFAVGGNRVLVPTGPAQHVTLSGLSISVIIILAGNPTSTTPSKGQLLQISFPSFTTYQGGILALEAFGSPAVRVHDNVVSTPAGQSLIVSGTGPMSIEGNSLATLEFRGQPEWIPAQAVFILNFGQAIELGLASLGLVDFASVLLTSFAPITLATKNLAGRILCDGNQARYILTPIEEKTFSLSLPCIIGSFDDVAIENNQFEAITTRADNFILFHVLGFGLSLRAIGNRFSEIPNTASLSYLGIGALNILTENQATHCLQATGSKVIQQLNQVLVSTGKSCENISAFLKSALGGQ